jgi:hypothetical protein
MSLVVVVDTTKQDDEYRILDWLESKYDSRFHRFWILTSDFVLFRWYLFRRRIHIEDVSIFRIMRMLLRCFTVLFLGAVPLVIAIMKGVPETPTLAAANDVKYWMISVVIVQFINWWIGTTDSSGLKRKSRNDHQGKAASEVQAVIDLVLQHGSRISFKKRHNILIQIVQGLIDVVEHQVRISFEDYGSVYYCANVLWFTNEKFDEIEILARSDRARGAGVRVKSVGTAAFYAAKLDRHIVVNDITSDRHPFRRKGFSGGYVQYRSFICIPITSPDGASRCCVGVLTIDSQRPYEFSGKAESDIVTMLKPYCSILALVLSSTAKKLRYKSGE